MPRVLAWIQELYRKLVISLFSDLSLWGTYVVITRLKRTRLLKLLKRLRKR